jgi:hypothetical protein
MVARGGVLGEAAMEGDAGGIVMEGLAATMVADCEGALGVGEGEGARISSVGISSCFVVTSADVDLAAGAGVELSLASLLPLGLDEELRKPKSAIVVDWGE